MLKKFVLLLCLLQVWHSAMPHPSVEDQIQPAKGSNQTFFNVQVLAESQSNFPIQIGNKFYYVEKTERINWHQALNACRQMGGHLLNFESSQEMDAILSIVPNDRYWISVNCLAENRNWISITTGEASPYLRWHPREPNNLKELCVELKRTALNDELCHNKLLYICEAKII